MDKLNKLKEVNKLLRDVITDLEYQLFLNNIDNVKNLKTIDSKRQ